MILYLPLTCYQISHSKEKKKKKKSILKELLKWNIYSEVCLEYLSINDALGWILSV